MNPIIASILTSAFITGLVQIVWKFVFDRRLETHKANLKRDYDIQMENLRAQLRHQTENAIETTKAKLKGESDVEVEKLKSQLTIAANQQNVSFSRYHERQITALEEMHSRLMDLATVCLRLSFNRDKGSGISEADFQQVDDAKMAFAEFYNKKKYFLSSATSKLFDDIFLHSLASHNFSTSLKLGFLTPDERKDTAKYLLEAQNKLLELLAAFNTEIRNVLMGTASS